MAAAQNLEITLDMVVKNQGDIATLFKQVDKLNAELKELQKITGGVEAPMRKMQNAVRGNTNAIDAVSKSARQNRQAMQMAGMQIGDFATQISTGSNPVQAFNQQIGQLGYALTTSATPALQRVGSILAGPWSIAILGATMILGPMIEKLFSASEAAEQLEEATDVLGETQSALGDYFDLSTGKIDDNSAATRINTQIKMANLRVTLQQLQADAALFNRLNDATQFGFMANFKSIFQGFGEPTAVIRGDIAETVTEMQGLLETVKRGGEEAEVAGQKFADLLSTAADLDFESVGLDSGKFLEAATKAFSAANLEELIGKAEEALRTGNLPEQFREIGRGARQAREGTDQAARALGRYINKLNDAANPADALRAELNYLNEAYAANAKDAEGAKLSTEGYRKEAERLHKSLFDLKMLEMDEGPLPSTLPTIEMPEIEVPDLSDVMSIEELKEIEAAFESIGNAVANGFKGMITGAQSFGDAMKRIIQSVIDELFRLYVVQQIVGFVKGALGGVFGGASPSGGAMVSGPAAAVGGYPQMNKPVLVGERGPELFVPTGSGKIVANHNLGGGGSGMVINVDARGSSDPEAVRQQVQQGILEAAPSIVAAAQNRTINTLRRPRLAGTL